MSEPSTDFSALSHTVSAEAAARAIASGDLTCEALATACLDRIAAREGVVHAFAHVDRDAVLATAHARDRGPSLGPLNGIPVAVKDVIDVEGMPTGMGSPIYAGYHPLADAACVAAVRAAGAVIIGKTVTAEFAGIAPGPTTHPADPTRTPGGSSSGSAAALADFMTPLAFGTQTGGSVLRPAAFCGVVGFKPSYGLLARTGVKPAAESLDTLGLMARTVGDIALLWRVLVGLPPRALPAPASPLRVGVFQTHHWPKASADMKAALTEAAARLAAGGARVEAVPLPDGFADLSKARVVINNYERARTLAWEWANHRAALSPMLAAVLADGWAQPYGAYVAALRLAEQWRGWFAGLMETYDLLLTPAANGVAPRGLATTGDTAFQEIWTLLHAPAISLPLACDAGGLPLGLQLVGRPREDEALLSAAAWAVAATAPLIRVAAPGMARQAASLDPGLDQHPPTNRPMSPS